MFGLALTYARREMRGGLKGFRVFLACLAMGVAAIAGVGSISSAIIAGLKADARVLLGGDVDLRLTHIRANDAQKAWLIDNSERLSEVATMRAMAVALDGEGRRLVELKAADTAYPLFGEALLEGAPDLPTAFSETTTPDGTIAYGAAVSPRLLNRLNLETGDFFKVGEATFWVSSVLASVPDKGNQGFELGPPVLVPMAGLEASGLIQPGSLIRYHYRVDLLPGNDAKTFSEAVKTEFPKAGWRIRALDNAAPNIQRFVDRVTLFLTLVGLTALLVGGVGVGNAVRAFLEARTGTIATLKCLGASSQLIFTTYMIQVMALGVLGVIAGLAIGTLAPIIAAPLVEGRLPVAARMGIYWEPLLLAAIFGILVTLIFALWPLAKAQSVPAATLFRNLLTPVTARPSARMMAVIAGAALLLTGIAVVGADNPRIAFGFVAGSAGSLLAFRLAATGVMRLARALPRPRSAKLRLAVANLHRPGAPTPSVIVSLGLGLTVMATVALIEGNLANQMNRTLQGEAPGFFFIDIQPAQIDAFDEKLRAHPTVDRVDRVPMLRGRITAMKDVPADQIDAPPDEAWILRGDRGFTWARTAPPNSEITAGEWWPEDYDGELLVSFDAEAAVAFGLGIGDKITINLLGREFEAKIANLRQIDWTTMGINFVMVFSPGILERAPQSYIATAYLDPAEETAVEAKIVKAFPNVSVVRMKEVLESVNDIVANLAAAVRVIAGIAIIAGVLVLAGAIAAGHARRVYDSVVLKVLGATRRDIATAFFLEYGLMGLVTALIASGVGTIAAYAVIEIVMGAEWIFIPWAMISTVALSVVITLGAGLAGTWVALGRKAAPLLRND